MYFEGKCQDLYEDGACGDDLGKRLYLGQDGEAFCDCLEGWLPVDGKCYQELTFAPQLCKNENEIIRWQIHKEIFFDEPTPEEKHQVKFEYVCEQNICTPDFLPHVSTWKRRKCHKVPEGSHECELLVAFDVDDDNPPLFCCHPGNRSSCDVDSFIGIHSLLLTKVSNFKCSKRIRP